ncbi:hypothetical protein DL96DRAFT_1523518 [Flagelloscypha sp. PMI_526]|nr:hypothetical protein DL96DRAFT_1523518 [Flagelloscypha sp. PMI_526]
MLIPGSDLDVDAIETHPSDLSLLQQLRSPFSVHPSEAWLSTATESTREYMNDIDAEIERHLQHIQDLQRLRERAYIDGKQRLCLTSPVRRLPLEILQVIFSFVCQDEPIRLPYAGGPPIGPILLTQVCNIWRVSALGNPALWTWLLFEHLEVGGEAQRLSEEFTSLVLSRSDQHPLHLSFNYGIYHESENTITSATGRALILEQHRWEDLIVRPWTLGYLTGNLKLTLPSLRSLELRRGLYYHSDTSFELRNSTRLRCLTITSKSVGGIAITAIDWSQILELTLDSDEGIWEYLARHKRPFDLKRLHITSPIKYPHLALKTFSSLDYLSIEVTQETSPQDTPLSLIQPPESHFYLHHLTLSFQLTSPTDFPWLPSKLPNLQILELTFSSTLFAENPADPFLAAMGRLFARMPQLQRLTLTLETFDPISRVALAITWPQTLLLRLLDVSESHVELGAEGSSHDSSTSPNILLPVLVALSLRIWTPMHFLFDLSLLLPILEKRIQWSSKFNFLSVGVHRESYGPRGDQIQLTCQGEDEDVEIRLRRLKKAGFTLFFDGNPLRLPEEEDEMEAWATGKAMSRT